MLFMNIYIDSFCWIKQVSAQSTNLYEAQVSNYYSHILLMGVVIFIRGVSFGHGGFSVRRAVYVVFR